MIDKEELLTLIPHRNSMMMLSRVTNYNGQEKSIEAEYDVAEDNIFYDSENGGLPAWTGFEFIAQAISAYIGIKARENGLPVKEGFILSVSQMRITLPFLKNKSIMKVKAIELDNVDSVYVFKGEMFLDKKEILSAKITVMEIAENINKKQG